MTENPAQIIPLKRDLLDPSINVKDLTPQEINERILQFMGVEPPEPCTYLILVAMYLPKSEEGKLRRKDGTESMLLMPESTADRMVYSACTGMVVAMGPDAYKDAHRFPNGPSCQLGDWITFPRHEGVQVRYRGVAMHWLPDDKVAMRIKDPKYVVRG